MSSHHTTQCSLCGNTYPRSPQYFLPSKYRDGLTAYCRECNREKCRIYYHKHKEEKREQELERGRVFYRNNRYEILAHQRQQKLLNKERVLAIQREATKRYKKNHPEQQRRHEKLKRNRKYNADGFHTSQEISSLFRDQEGYCFHCGVDIILVGYHIDHWVPLSRGGSDYIANIRLLCPHCNQVKYNKLPHEWSPERYSSTT